MYSKNYKITTKTSYPHISLINQEFKPESNSVKPFYILQSISQYDRNRQQNKSCLRNIYPNTRYERQFGNLFIIEQIADMFILFTISNGLKIMTHTEFRSFIKKSNLVNDKFSSDNLDIIFYDLSKKWEFYNRKKSGEHIGLCYHGYLEFFLTYSQLNFNEKNLELNAKSLLTHCKINQKPIEQQIVKITDDIYEPTEKLTIEQEIKSRISSSRCGDSLSKNGSASSISSISRSEMKRKSKKSLFPIFF